MLSEDEVTTRAAYDQLAADYAAMFPDLGAEAPEDRALIDTFADQVRGRGPALDAGCGTGRVAAHLRSLGIPTVAVDLSLGMLAEAHRRHPQLPIAACTLLRLPVRAGGAGGVLAWYSVIHTPPADLPLVIAELARALAPGGPLLLGFQCGQGERVDRTGAFGHPARRVAYRHQVDRIEQLLGRYDVEVARTVVRDPVAAHETTQQAFLLGSRRTGA